MSQVVSDSHTHKGSAPVARSLVTFAQTLRLGSMFNLLSRGGENLLTPKEERKQSDSAAPVVLVNELSKGMGSEVEVTLRHDLRGMPTMGTDELEGREEERTKAHDSIKIDRTRHAVKDGDKYDIQERGYDIAKFSRSDLGRYFHKIEDQRLTYHLAGDRGHDSGEDIIIPNRDHPKFKKIMVNDIKPPTANRHRFAGGADCISGGATPLTAADNFDRALMRRIKEEFEEMANPIEPCDFTPEGNLYSYDPMYTWWITPRMWTQFFEDAAGKELNQMIANAHAMDDKKQFASLFRGECFLFENFLVRKSRYPVRFVPGRKVDIADPGRRQLTITEQMIPANAKYAVERGLIIGGQALGMAFGNAAAGAKSGHRNFDFETETRDFKAKKATAIGWVSGCKKLSFADADGTDTDRGVFAVDCAVPLKAGDVR